MLLQGFVGQFGLYSQCAPLPLPVPYILMPPRNLPTAHFHSLLVRPHSISVFINITRLQDNSQETFPKIRVSLIHQCPVSTLDFYRCFMLKSPKQKSFSFPHTLFFLLFIDTTVYTVTEARGPRLILASTHLQHLIINSSFPSLRERYGRK